MSTYTIDQETETFNLNQDPEEQENLEDTQEDIEAASSNPTTPHRI
jgi:hypothetical protein